MLLACLTGVSQCAKESAQDSGEQTVVRALGWCLCELSPDQTGGWSWRMGVPALGQGSRLRRSQPQSQQRNTGPGSHQRQTSYWLKGKQKPKVTWCRSPARTRARVSCSELGRASFCSGIPLSQDPRLTLPQGMAGVHTGSFPAPA